VRGGGTENREGVTNDNRTRRNAIVGNLLLVGDAMMCERGLSRVNDNKTRLLAWLHGVEVNRLIPVLCVVIREPKLM
jgi:hypothetical protein